ncbi:DEAD/DEAH box helicase [Acinetobacter baumannii]|uniref:DEAD/DEAH box helicase n=1 Tax=Acinetobacter baumannii TaxID=470 RepID=UPI0024DE69C3|nr:DEAD/DEAH box helicase family protein [Acinetobacter baumannii]MDK2170249.1 DEAD/DEAH box helicase family protein [Acinetobacter baumannii]MDK2181070.1 DEAD/DEAH box helicase family protein [Acinetobacter baumannii]MDK2327151.1 DEAD/DEAH box helicase family protein [Acinetobacter baumannii]
MNLNSYQRKVIQDLEDYLNHLQQCQGNMLTAFSSYWRDAGITGVTYTNHIANCPHVCFKVPTAGGKTFIAVNSIAPIFDFMQNYISDKSKLVLWLVPSLSILQQTAKALKDPAHPYHLHLKSLFNGRVNVFEREEVLTGAGFNRDSVRDSLNIIVMSFDALKSTNKDNRRAFKENGALASFAEFKDTSHDLSDYDSTSLINTLRRMRPVIIVDESHNANTKLSTDMLNNLNPSFVLDLTATPKENSNVISYTNATALVKENMVKLPVVVYNKQDEQSVFVEAKVLRERLEQRAIQQHQAGGDYVRPIVLLQAESKSNLDATDYEKVRQTLIDLGIPKEQIKIKTANIDELKGVNLLSKECEVRYIITINALKEGWDCSFAYILATFANRSSETDVTQLLGRILRKPYARKQDQLALECSYVITASKKFNDTLSQLSNSLQMIGFGSKDMRVPDENFYEKETQEQLDNYTFDLSQPVVPENSVKNQFNKNIPQHSFTEENTSLQEQTLDDLFQIEVAVQDYQQDAREQDLNEINRQEIAQQDGVKKGTIQMNLYPMREKFTRETLGLLLPRFTIKVQSGGFFDEDTQLLDRVYLLRDFKLSNQDSNLDIGKIDSEIWQLNVKDSDDGSDTRLILDRLKQRDITDLINQVAQMTDTSQIKQIEDSIFNSFTKKAFYPVDDGDLRLYIRKIVSDWTREQRISSIKNLATVAQVFKHKIDGLMNEYAAKQFKYLVDSSDISVSPSFQFASSLAIPETFALPLANSLYEKEAKANNLEVEFIRKLVGLENIEWWHRNLSRGKGFAINGYLNNHYPDFIILTKNKYIILLETKGEDRDGSDSTYKMKLGEVWKNQANLLSHQTGYKYSYFMVFEKETKLEQAYGFNQVLQLIGNL